MSNNAKIGVIAVVAVAIIGVGYMVYNNGSGTSSTNSAAVNGGSNATNNASTTTTPTKGSKDAPSNFTVNGDATVTKTVNNPVTYEGPLTSVSYTNMEHDFGKIDQQTENEHIFKFTNTGSDPLVISNAKGSCGCTVPEYPKDPIAPGEDGEIRVVYKPGKQKNKQTKRVTVTANTDPAQTVLKITAEVQELPAQ